MVKITMRSQKNEANRTLELKSFAKINLFLDVLDRLENGYHSILTLFSEVELYDILKFSLTKNEGIKILSTNKNLASQENLIYKIAIFIQNRYGVRCGAQIELEKRIPIAAGLGGGSSNAATTIKGLSILWELDLSKTEMHNIAAQFGSDINFFLEGYQAIGRNRGEIIEPLEDDLNFENILLVNPNFEISSKEAYKLLDLGSLSSPSNNQLLDSNYKNTLNHYPLNKLLEKRDFEFCYNKLEEGICKKYPTIQTIIKILKENGAIKAILSGSGPTTIGFFENSQTMKNAQKIVKEMNFWNYITTIRRRPKK